MIFWNALTTAALRARCACAMYKYRLLAAAGGFYPMEGRRVRFLVLIPVSIVLLMTYNARSQSRSTSAKKNVVKRSEEHTSELQSQSNLVCRLLLEQKKTTNILFN